MTTNPQHTGSAFEIGSIRSQRLLARSLPLAAAALVCLGGCAATAEEMAEDVIEEPVAETSDTNARAAADPAREALRSGAYATPENVGGFCVDGVGVFLTAVDDAAELTVYVVAPAQSATFVRPALHLTVRDGDHSMTEVEEFEDVTLQAGESHVFRREASGPVMDAFANFVGAE